MSLVKFLAAIGHFFAGLFNKAKEAFTTLEPGVQEAMKKASGILAIITQYESKVPDDIWALITAKFPELTKDNVTAWLTVLAKELNIIQADFSGGFNEVIQELQAYFAKTGHTTWAALLQAGTVIIADLIAPGAIVQKLIAVCEYVYQTFVKHWIDELLDSKAGLSDEDIAAIDETTVQSDIPAGANGTMPEAGNGAGTIAESV